MIFSKAKYFVILILLFGSNECFSKKINFSSCVETSDAPRCLVDAAHKYSHTKRDADYIHIMLLGADDWIVKGNKALVSRFKSDLEVGNDFFKSLGIEMRDEESAKSKEVVSDILMAAYMLATVAQNNKSPYENEKVKIYLEKAKNDYAVSRLALDFWSNHDTYGLWKSLETEPKGLKEILNRVLNSSALDARTLSNLIWDWDLDGSRHLELVAHQKLDILLARSSNDDKANLASMLARIYFDSSDAELLMLNGGILAENYDIAGIKVQLAAAKLHKQYNVQSAMLLVDFALGEKEIETASYRIQFPQIAKVLGRANAVKELRILADGYLATAEIESFGPEKRGSFYALASECYLRANDKEAAMIAAKKGLSQVPLAVKLRSAKIKDPDMASPSDLIRSSRGWGADPVVALYRSGAFEEAKSTGYLDGKTRYKYAVDLGETPDPNWLIDYYWLNADEAESIDHDLLYLRIEQRKALYFAAKKWIETHSWAWANQDIQLDLAQLAASIGARESMKMHLSAVAEQIGKEKEDADFFALELAEQWARDLRIVSYYEDLRP